MGNLATIIEFLNDKLHRKEGSVTGQGGDFGDFLDGKLNFGGKVAETKGQLISKCPFGVFKLHSVRFWGFLSKNYFSFEKQLIYHQNHY